MPTTTEFGTFADATGTTTVEAYVRDALGPWPEDGIDVEAVAREYRDAINAALPKWVSLNGNVFYGPYRNSDRDHFRNYPLTEDGDLDIRAIVDRVDFWPIVERHDHSIELV